MNEIAGIYRIKCLGNNQLYVGSSIDIHHRWREHRRTLISGSHHNSYLQRSHNKYTMGSLVFQILEIIQLFEPTKDFQQYLIQIEQYYIDTLKAKFNSREAQNSIGYTLPEHRIIALSKPYSFINPNGELIEGLNLKALSREYGLDNRAMRDVLNGVRFQHKNWTNNLENHQKLIKYGRDGCLELEVKVISPIGEEYCIYNLAEFAREHNLDSGNLRLLVQGHLISHKKWKLKNSRDIKRSKPNSAPYYLVDPNSNIYEGVDVSSFAKEHNLVDSNLRAVVTGREFSHYGYTNSMENHLILKAKQEQQSKPIFAKSPDGIEYEIKEGFKKFALEHNLNAGNLQSVLNGKRKHNKNWIVYYKDTNNNQPPSTQNENI